MYMIYSVIIVMKSYANTVVVFVSEMMNCHIYVGFSGHVQSTECIQDVIRFAADEELFLLVDEESVLIFIIWIDYLIMFFTL